MANNSSSPSLKLEGNITSEYEFSIFKYPLHQVDLKLDNKLSASS
jgi:hypothetical protein